MFSKSIKTTSGPLKITIPEDIKELTIGQLMAMTPEPGHSFSDLELLSKLSGIPTGENNYDTDKVCLYDTCNTDDLQPFYDVMQTIAYQLKAFITVQEIPEEVTLIMPHDAQASGRFKRWFNRDVKGKVVPVISNLGIAPAGAYYEAKELIRAEYELWERVKAEYGEHIEFNPSIECQAKLLAIYFYCPATGNKYSTKTDAFLDVVKQLPVTQGLPIARYFFLRFPNLSKPKVRPSLESLRTLRRGQA